MKSFAVLAVSFLFALPLRGETLALVGGTTINPANAKVIEHATIVIAGEKIQAVGTGQEVTIPDDARRIDCVGKFIIPGLWDMHVHVAGVTADPKWGRDSLLPLLVANGVTGIRDMGGNLDALVKWRREIEAGSLVGPRIFACGPFLADAKPGTPYTIPIAKPAQGRRAVQTIKQQHGDFVKILNHLSRESYFAIAEEAKFQEIPFVGHVPDSVTATEASNAGQKSIEHIFYSNLAFDCSSQETELRQQRAEAAEKKDSAALAKIRVAAEASFDPTKAEALWQTFRRNNTWVVPTLIAIDTIAHQLDLAENENDPRLAYVPPALRAQWTPTAIAKDLTPEVAQWYREQSEYDLKVVRSMHAAGVSIIAGSDSLDPFDFPGSSLHDELKMFGQAGFTPIETLQAATINPARFLNRDQPGGFGAIEAGRLADLVVLDANPLEEITNTRRIQAVVFNGRLLDRAELDKLLEQARAAVAHD